MPRSGKCGATVLVEHELQMPMVQDEDVVEAFPPDRADRPSCAELRSKRSGSAMRHRQSIAQPADGRSRLMDRDRIRAPSQHRHELRPHRLDGPVAQGRSRKDILAL
jgi:hypothetical protein